MIKMDGGLKNNHNPQLFDHGDQKYSNPEAITSVGGTSLEKGFTWHESDEQFDGVSSVEDEAQMNDEFSSANMEMELAIVGLAGRFPKAKNLDTFWRNLCEGIEAISFFTDEEVEKEGVTPGQYMDPHYVKASGVLDDADQFDAGFFNIYPREAAIMDPQHRVFLEVAWEALENAGYNPEAYPGYIGLFAGSSMNTYMIYNLLPNREIMSMVDGYQLNINNDKDFLPTRVSYKFNMRGPSVNIQTACSTSLVAAHIACQSLLSYQCDMALAGGVSIRLPQKAGYLYSEGGISSPDGHCRAFDAQAAGTVPGNGVGVVVIKRLADAIRDRDTIHAVIKGSSINNDGSLKVGYTAPSIDGQVEVIATAQAVSNVDPATISYIEAHGTGTSLGDPIEIAALTQVFRESTDKKQYCAIGSVKTNIGHLDAAAGVTSLIKTTLALKNRKIPASLHYTRPNPKIDFENSPFYVNTHLRDWQTNGLPRRAGISSFGIGGTNVHMILEEAPIVDRRLTSNDVSTEASPSRPWKLLVISARSNSALEAATDNLVNHMDDDPEVSLDDAAYTLQVGRKAFSQRRFLVCSDFEDARRCLRERDPSRLFTGAQREDISKEHPQIVFMFSGQGSQYINMGRELYETEPVFRSCFDQCAEILRDYLDQDLREVIFLDSDAELEAKSQTLMQTALTQPALFVVEYSLARLLMDWGIMPQAMIGHSIGEYVAACLADVLTLEDALKIIAARGRLMQNLPAGAMISIPLSEAEVRPYLGPGLSLAAVNAPELCVVSGSFEDIDGLIYRLANDGIEFRRLRTSHAFHSEMMDPILDTFRLEFNEVELTPPSIPIISNFSGKWMTDQQATDPGYWTRHLRQTVRFSEGVSEFLKDTSWILLEVGPGQALVTLAKDTAKALAIESQRYADEIVKYDDHLIYGTIRPPRSQLPDAAFLLTTIGKLWLAGVPINWERYHSDENLYRIPLPTYPFEHKRYWVEPDIPLGRLLLSGGRSAMQSDLQLKGIAGEEKHEHYASQIVKNNNLNQWFYHPSWQRKSLVTKGVQDAGGGYWLILEDAPNQKLDADRGTGTENWLGDVISTNLPANTGLIRVVPGDRYEKIDQKHFIVNPNSRADFQALLNDLKSAEVNVGVIVHLWSLSTEWDSGRQNDPYANFMGSQKLGMISLLNLLQGLSGEGYTQPIEICVATKGAQEITGDEMLSPQNAPIVAICKVISQEYPNFLCRNIDFDPINGSIPLSLLADRIISEIGSPTTDRFVAWRGNYRWIQVYEAIPYEEKQLEPSLLRQGGVYLITGGLGRIGLSLAETLAKKIQARLALVDQIEFPNHDDWQKCLDEDLVEEGIKNRVRRLIDIERIGASVLVMKADISDPIEIKSVFDSVLREYGEVNGIIHAAGLVGEAAIKALAEVNSEDILRQFLPKVGGLLSLSKVLDEYQDQLNIDFILLQSSLSTVLGGLGLGAYAAANAAMDSLATLNNRSMGQSRVHPHLDHHQPGWIIVNWDGWQFGAGKGEATTISELSMTPEEGNQIFEKVISLASQGLKHIVISTADLGARVDKWVTKVTGVSTDLAGQVRPGEAQEGAQSDQGRRGTSFPRPNLATPYVAPRDEIETQIVEAWEKILGISPIGVYDDFFELGGHSLLATQLVTRLRDAFKVELPLRRLFEAPTIAGLVGLINEARSDEGGEKLQPDLDDSRAQLTQEIMAIPRDGNLELSFGQQRLWFIDQLDPGSPLYNNFAALRLSGSLNIDGLNYCVMKITARHESLRTTFAEVEGKPVQIIHDQMDIPLEVIDLQANLEIQDEGDPKQTINARIQQLAIEEARKPFNLSQGPLLRIKLLRIRPEEHVFFLTMHHIVSDGWSVGVLVTEVGALYTAYLDGLNKGQSENEIVDVLPPLPIQYADFAAWQREWLKSEILDEQIDYWKKDLWGSQNLDLFTDFPRPPVQSWQGANEWFEFPESLSSQLAGFSQKEGATLFMTLLAGLQALLFRYSGQEDISIGTPIANRTRAEVEGLIGFVLNTLVMRTDLSGDPTFRELVNRVRDTALGAYAYQDLPFEMLVEALQPERDMSRAPFFQVMFDLQVEPLQSLDLPGLTILPIAIDSGTAKFDLALSMEEINTPTIGDKGRSGVQRKHGLRGYLNYNSALFLPDTIRRMLKHFQNLLASAVENPDLPLSQLALIDEEEKFQILEMWSHIDTSLPGEQDTAPHYLHQAIHEQSLRKPDEKAITLVESGALLPIDHYPTLTYRELDQRVQKLARLLISLGVGPETLVGLCMERSLEMIVGLLGILNAGGAFLPLDPSYPIERLEFMLLDSQTPVVLSQQQLLETNPSLVDLFHGQKVRVVRLDQDEIQVDEEYRLAQISDPRPGEIDPLSQISLQDDNLAYVIYTSGSTGKPKGVEITHRSIANHIRDMVCHFEITPDDHVLQFASLNFDAGLEQVFTTLTSGAWLVLRDDDVWPPEEFHQKIKHLGLSVVNVPPAYWQPWVKYVSDIELDNPNGLDDQEKILSNHGVDRLKLVIIGGDLMLTDTLKLWWQTSLSKVRLLNAYGPTETTITATTYQVPDEPVDHLSGNYYARIPIGRIHPNRLAFILDRFGNPTPVGVPGELHLGGDYLARGYFRQPELSAEKFIPNPLNLTTLAPHDSRLYKTGDLVRYLPSGMIDFIGRVDQQVKLRGFRIELGEIEAVISSYPQIDETMVVVHGDGEQDKRLLAFYINQTQTPLDPVDIYEFVKEKLPAYMLPAAFVEVKEFPLTPSGKVDRKALAKEASQIMPGDAHSIRKVQYVAPRTGLEAEIAELWKDVLSQSVNQEISEIGIFDNFFELGGHSLIATQIVSRLREAYHIDLPLREMFENPTIAGIAELIAKSLVTEESEDELEALLAELEGMSEEDVQALLANNNDLEFLTGDH